MGNSLFETEDWSKPKVGSSSPLVVDYEIISDYIPDSNLYEENHHRHGKEIFVLVDKAMTAYSPNQAKSLDGISEGGMVDAMLSTHTELARHFTEFKEDEESYRVFLVRDGRPDGSLAVFLLVYRKGVPLNNSLSWPPFYSFPESSVQSVGHYPQGNFPWNGLPIP